MLERFFNQQTVPERLGLAQREGPLGPYLRAILAFVAEQPVAGNLVKGFKEAISELSDEAEDNELERKFADLMTVGGQTNENILLLNQVAQALYEQHSALLDSLSAQQLHADKGELDSLAKLAALTAYRNQVANEYMYADHRGIEGVTRQEHIASLLLDDIYVLPAMVAERDRLPLRDRERDVLHKLLSDQDLEVSARDELELEYATLSGERWRLGRPSDSKLIQLNDCLATAPHAVVLGGPGVGKSTLSRFLARTYALGGEHMESHLGRVEELTPILLPLALFADARSTRPHLTVREFIDEFVMDRGGYVLKAAIADLFPSGEILLLLDGVDEVPDTRTRELLVQAIDRFLLDNPQIRMWVTSRPYGYVRLQGDVPHFTLPNFTPAQVARFISQWHRANERKQHPDAPDFDDAEAEAEALISEIQRNPKVMELAANPLMLVIVSLIRYERTRLPEERVQLYHRAVNTLMDTWNQWRSRLGHEVEGLTLPLDRLVRVWGRIAEWTRRERNTGIVHRAELKRKLVEVLREREYDEYNPEATAEAYLQAAAQRAGILEERGPDIFAFWHPTFEEFLAAVEVATPATTVVPRLLAVAEDPRWREVVLLTVGYLGVVQRDQDTATNTVRALMEEQVPATEELFHGRLRLAAACVADDVGVKRSLGELIIIRLAEIVKIQPYEPNTNAFVSTVRALRRFQPAESTLAILSSLSAHPDAEVRAESTRLVANATTTSDLARVLCTRSLQDEHASVRAHAALGLLRTGQREDSLWAVLATALPNEAQIDTEIRGWLRQDVDLARYFAGYLASPDEKIRRFAANYLRDGGFEDSVLIPRLREILEDADIQVRGFAAHELSRSGERTPEVLLILRGLLESGDSHLCDLGVEGLMVDGTLEDADVALLGAKLASESYDVRACAVRHLLTRRQIDESVIEAGVELLRHPGGTQAFEIVLHLSRAVPDNTDFIAVLRELIRGEDIATMAIVMAQLKHVGLVDNDVIDDLKAGLKSDIRARQFMCAIFLQQHAPDDAEVVAYLQEMLRSKDDRQAITAAFYLQQFPAMRDQASINLLKEWIQGEDPDRVLGAAGPLIELEEVDEQVLGAMIRFVSESPSSSLVSCKRVLQGEDLSSEDVGNLVELVSVEPTDSALRRNVREWFFQWLLASLTPEEKVAV